MCQSYGFTVEINAGPKFELPLKLPTADEHQLDLLPMPHTLSYCIKEHVRTRSYLILLFAGLASTRTLPD
jgi:hypothetical protein